MSSPEPEKPAAWRARRISVLAILVAGTVVLLLEPVHMRLLALFGSAEPVIRLHPIWGMVLFVLLAIVSALVLFVSSVVLLPVAIYAWGPVVSALLLWTGWFIGGLLGYTTGRFLGRPLVRRAVGPATMARYEAYAARAGKFLPILLLQLAIPSDTAGYLFGMVRCPVRPYLLALALAELPYAVGAVYLGTSFLERRILPLLALGAAGAMLSLWALHSLQGRARSAR